MRALLQLILKLPPEARLFGLMTVILIPLATLGLILPMAIVGWLLAGVALIFLALFGVLLYYRLRAQMQGHWLDREISEQATGPSRRELAEKDREYRKKWMEGIDKLQKARISLYDLPWYIVIGEPGGGKTMTLLNSGMDFPMGKDELPGFGGTRNYNWWFTNTAVILDTAGRLVFEQEGTSDRHEWEAFLKLLKRRRRCPINGVVVTLPADKLMSDTAEQRDRSASVIRERLRQIQTILDVRYPVFLLITKADLVAGFTEFFNDLDSLQRNQLFGYSRPGEFDTVYDPAEFSQDFDALYRQLHDLRLNFLGRNASDIELGWIHTYPEAFRTLKDRIQDYIDVIFSRNIFAEPLFFRGFYFTSSLQEGTPFLQILGQHLSDENLENLEGIFPQSRAFFIHDFYTRKVAREQGMVFRSQKHINRMRLLKRSTLLIGVPMFILLSGLTALGYFAYRRTASEPIRTIQAANELVRHYRNLQEEGAAWQVEGPGSGDLARAVEVVESLDRAAETFENPSGLAGLMFGSISNEAEADIRRVQRELIGYCILRPEVARVEQALSALTVPLTPDNIGAFQGSLRTYLLWHFGDDQGSLEGLRRVLPSANYALPGMSEMLDDFAKVHNGRLAGGLTANMSHRREVLSAALEAAREYWLTTTDVMQHPDFVWWQQLLARCDEVRTRYGALLAGHSQFRAAAGRREFMDAVAAWLALFPQPPAAATAGSAASTQLLQPLREHLRAAPRREEGGPIIMPRDIVEANRDRAATFWAECLAALPQSEDELADERVAEAATLRERIAGFQQELEREIDARGSELSGRLLSMQDIIEPRPRNMPMQYTFVDAAVEAERVLHDNVASRLQDLDASLPAALERWTEEVERLLGQRAADVNFTLSAEWNAAGLRLLVEDIERARSRFQGRLLIDEIGTQLAERPTAGLAHFLDGHDENNMSRSLGFDNLLNRHTGSFLRRAVNGRQRLLATLATAAERNLVADYAGMERLLNEAMRDYAQDYSEAWSNAYGDFQFEQIQDFSFNRRPRSWDAYRNWIRENGGAVKRAYRDRFETVLQHAVKPFLKGAPLADFMAEISWPRDSRLQAIVEQWATTAALPEAAEVLSAWDRYDSDIEDFRLAELNDLSRERIAFPSLQANAALQHEWLTRQLQFVIDYGQWRLWADIQHMLVTRLAPFDNRRPFVFEGGGTTEVDPLALLSVLDDIGKVHRFQQAQGGAGLSEAQGPWLARAAAWRALLGQDIWTLEVDYAPPPAESGKQGTADFYTKVVLSLPGMSSPDGRPMDQLLFEATGATPQRVRWAPTAGAMLVALRDLNPSLKGRDAPLQPRVLEMRRQEYPLIGFLQRHGVREPDGWRVELSKNVKEIQGLVDLEIDPAERWVVIRFRFVEPQQGLPEPLAWPQEVGQESRPRPPWRSDS